MATFYQLYLQRIHNEKSLKPIVQIDLVDISDKIAVHVQNNGIGPYIIKRLSYVRDGESTEDIETCLQLDPRTYQHISPLGSSVKTVLPNNFLPVFSIPIDGKITDKASSTRTELSKLKLVIEGVDIYDNRIIIERELDWFVRHQSK